MPRLENLSLFLRLAGERIAIDGGGEHRFVVPVASDLDAHDSPQAIDVCRIDPGRALRRERQHQFHFGAHSR